MKNENELPINVKSIPTSLREHPQWVCWRRVYRKDKWTKVPINPKTGGNAQSNNPETWTTFSQATEFWEKNKEDGVKGMGFEVRKEDPYTGVDLDYCRNPETGEIESWASLIVAKLNSYTEVTPSQEGLRVWVKGKLPPGKRSKGGIGNHPKGKIEFYDERRFFTLTGWHLEGTPATIEDRAGELNKVYSKFFGDSKPQTKLQAQVVVKLEDSELIKKAKSAANGDKFTPLWAGDWSGFPSQSEADLSLCSMLAFWTGGAPGSIDSLFRQSGLMRPKWDERRGEKTYGQMTLERAIEQGGETYSPTRMERKLCTNLHTASTPQDRNEKEEIQVGINLTDLGNARRFVASHGGGLRYCYPRREWLAWDGQRWKTDETGEVIRRAKETIRLMYQEAAGTPDEDQRKKLANHALKSESDSKIKAMLSLAQSEPGIPILPEAMDKDPWLLNVSNGTIDLRRGELTPHSRDNFITKMAKVDFVEDAPCPLWRKHLQKIMAGNTELTLFLQRAFGYSLSGNTDERVMFIEHGGGANGKTVTNETVAMIMGDYALRTPTETLLQKKYEGAISNDLARLRGARFAFASEADEGRRLSESVIKDLSGGDTISARHLYQEYREFRPECKLWLSTNHRPDVKGTDSAIWDRIRLIPFSVSIPEKERIPRRDLMAQFAEELPGILAWMVKGCLNWQGAGLGIPAEVRQATAEYRDEMDVLKNFFNQCCMVDGLAETTAKSLSERYLDWCIENREKPMTQTKLGKRLAEMGFHKEPKRTGVVWFGFGLTIQE